MLDIRLNLEAYLPALDRELDAHFRQWGKSENNRKAKYYKITAREKKALADQEQTWTRLSAAVHQVLAK